MQTKKNEIWVGIFLLAALLAALFVLSFCLGRYGVDAGTTCRILLSRLLPLEQTWTGNEYTAVLNIRLPRIVLACLVGCCLSSAVGRVADITLDPKTYLPRVTLEIEQRYNHIPDTSSLSIRTSGLLGEQYLALNVGFEDPELGTAILKDGDTIQDTKSAMVLEDLIGQFLYGSKGDDNKNSGDAPAAAPGNNETTEPVGTTK